MRTLRFAWHGRLRKGLFIGTIAFSPLLASYGSTAQAASPAAFSTFDASQGGCQDSPNGVNCNHYGAKTDVYLNGGPASAALADGDYFFAILPPGYQNGGFLEGAAGNLSDATAGGTAGDSGSGDAQANRTFHVTAGLMTYAGTHKLGVDPQGQPVIQAAPFDDTDAAGGNYILAICSVGATSSSDCKFDEFQVGGSAGGADGGTASDGGSFGSGGGDGSKTDEPPVASCQPVTVCANAVCQAAVSINNGSYDPDNPVVSLSQSPAGPYSLGTQTVTLTVSADAKTATCSAPVTVNDCTPPQIVCPAPVTAECTGNSQAVVAMPDASATDNCVAPGIAQVGTQSYPLGTTAVGYTATDGAGNASSCASAVTVVDTTPPSITCPAPITAECTGDGQAVVDTGAASASDTCSPVTVTDPAPASYALGTSTVTHSAADTSNNTASCSGSVTVVDTTPPAITCPASVTAECTGDNHAVVDSGYAAAVDICTIATVSDPAPASYPLGTTAVTHSATDLAGNSSSCQNDVSVVDTTPPQISASGGPQLWPPDHKYVLVGLDACGVAINDVCNGSLSLSQSAATIVSVTSDEVVLSTGVGSGHTTPDIVVVDPQHVNLRAERAGTGDGRVYTIHFKAEDHSGNWGTGACQVTVPHDQNPGSVVVDSGVKYTVTYP